MKRVITILLFVILSSIMLASITENFDDWSDGSYGGIVTYESPTSGHWENNNAMSHSTYARSGNAIRFNDDSSSTLEYLLYKGMDGNGKDNGIGTISFWYRHWDGNVPSEPIEFTVEYQIGSTTGSWTAIGSTVNVTSTTYTEYSQAVDLSGDDIFIRISNVQDKERLLIDDISITDFGGSGNSLTAAFSANVTTGTAPLTVNFTDATSGGTPPYTYAWDFENDSTNDSTTQNPSFTYSSEGTYSVKLTVTDSAARTADVELKTDYITVSANPDYYAGITATTGSALKSQLHDLIDNHSTYSYTSLNPYLMVSDADPNNSSKVIEVYTGDSEYSVSSKEHVWAKSHGEFSTTAPAGSDMHNLKPCQSNINSTRSNKDFDNGGTEVTDAPGNYTDSDSWEPRDAVKGDIARIIFYMATRYEGDVPGQVGEPDLEIVDQVNTENNDNGLTGYGEHGKLSTLLLWHVQDPVDSFELNRNDVIEGYQGNRNPFIDHPEWVSTIWGDAPATDVTIYDIQYISDPVTNDASPYAGQTVSTSGIVTASNTDGYFISSAVGGAWNGVYVDDAINSPSEGDEVSITGTVEEYYNFTRITSVSAYTVDSFGNTLPSPTVIATNALEEQYEGVLVQVQNVTVSDIPDGYNQWDVNDGSGACEIDDLFYMVTPDPQIGDDFSSVTGVVNYSYSVFDINPRYEADLVEPVTPNVDPIADAGTSYSAIDVDLDGWADVTLDASGSTDSDGAIVSYEWTWDDGQTGGGAASDLFFSEYVEGSGNNKYLEIYNGTGSIIDLSTYSVHLYSNGALSPSQNLSLSGSLADGTVYIIGNSSGALTGFVVDETSAVTNFNGDDTITLLNNGTLIDCIGQIGFDPGSAWGISPTRTADATLVRKSTVTSGDSDGSDAFDPSAEWDGYASDTATYLGSHTMGAKTTKVAQNASGESITRSFPLGTTTVTLSVTDNDGGTHTDTATVTVSEPTSNQTPTIVNISHSPTNPDNTESVTVSADITDIDGTIAIAEIQWGLTSGSLTNTVSMAIDTGDTFTGIIPAQVANETVYYVVSATDDDTDETVSSELSYIVTEEQQVASKVIFTEVCDPADYNASYIEIYNAGNLVQNLRGWSIVQYNSSQTTVLDDTINTDLVTNMTGDYPLQPGEFAILIRGTLSDLLATFPAFTGNYFVDGSNSAGAPQINGEEYFELYDNQAKAIVDRMGSATNTIQKDKVYERLDADTDGSEIDTQWAEASGDTTGTPSEDNFNPLNNDQNALPVVFSYMLATAINEESVGLEWKTETESDLSHFRIYRNITDNYIDATLLNTSIDALNGTSGNNYSFIDTEVYLGIDYYYWIEAVSISGGIDLYGPAYVKVGEFDGGDTPEVEVLVTSINSVFPNPFNPSTTIEYSLKNDTNIEISVFNMKGQKVVTLLDSHLPSGNYSIEWSGEDSKRTPCGSGIYFFKLITNNKAVTRKAILMK